MLGSIMVMLYLFMTASLTACVLFTDYLYAKAKQLDKLRKVGEPSIVGTARGLDTSMKFIASCFIIIGLAFLIYANKNPLP